MVFFRMAGFEWDNRGRRSDRRELAMDGLMTCGMAVNGRDIVTGIAEVKSFG
jgi:hypothetical protein